MERKLDSLIAAERSLDVILEVVRHMQYYVAPWQSTNLEREAALAVRDALGTKDSPIYRRFLELDPLFGSSLNEAFSIDDKSRLVDLAKDFDLSHHSHLSQTVAVSLRSLAKTAREEQAYLA